MYLFIRGICDAVKIKVNGIKPQTLKLTHIASLCVLHTISLRKAKKIKKIAHLLFNLSQPNSLSLKAFSKKIFKKFLLKNNLLINKVRAKTMLTIVGFTYKKTGLLKYKERPPKIEIIIAPINGI